MPTMRWSLRSMFVATALVAVASLAAKNAVVWLAPICMLATPIFLCAAVGTLRGNLGLWVRYGVGVDIVLLGLALTS
jgi:hypothetical protein